MQNMKFLGEYHNKEAGSLPELVFGILQTSSADSYIETRRKNSLVMWMSVYAL
jgi:hypothetical protein